MSTLNCDFCGKEAETLIRVAIDKEYDRLTVKHQKRYACQECSDKKEKERQQRVKAQSK